VKRPIVSNNDLVLSVSRADGFGGAETMELVFEDAPFKFGKMDITLMDDL
jgi:hypothetical protein